MSKDRKSLIRLASSLPKGDKSRRAILAGLKKSSLSKRANMGTFLADSSSMENVGELIWVIKSSKGAKAYIRVSRYEAIILDKVLPLKEALLTYFDEEGFDVKTEDQIREKLRKWDWENFESLEVERI